MRLLLVSTSPVTAGDGRQAAGSFVSDLVEAIADAGHRCAIVCPGTGRGAAARSGAAELYEFRVPRQPLSLLKPARPDHWPAIAATLKRGAEAVDRAVRLFEPDHILALWVLPSGHWARRASLRHGVPYSTWALGSDIWSLGRIAPLRSVLASVMSGAEARFADGHELCDRVREIGGGDCSFLASSRRLPPPRVPRALPSRPPFRLAFVGRWHENKGVDLLLEGLFGLPTADWARIEGVRVAGGGPLEPEVGKAVASLRREGRPCELLGYVDKQQAADLYAWADYLIIPSRIESIPVVFSDALQAGRPVIATPVGDLPRLLAEFPCGTLAAAADALSIRDAVRDALARDPCAYAEGIARAATRFDLASTVERLGRLPGR